MSRSLKERRRKELQQARWRRRLLIGVPTVLLVIALSILVYLRFLQRIDGLQEFSGVERGHATNVNVASSGAPPTGGVHAPQWLNCGIYDAPVDALPAMHSLEHGAVWLTYRPALPPDQVAALEAYAQGGSHILVSPYPDQESNIVATGWGVQLATDSLPDERIDRFIARYRGQGPEPGAPCANGVGTPRNS